LPGASTSPPFATRAGQYRETIGVVAVTDDQTRPHDGDPARHHLFGLLLATSLQRAVILTDEPRVRGRLRFLLVRHLDQFAVLVDRFLGHLRVHGAGRHEHVEPDVVLQHRQRILDELRHVAVGVDHGVEFAPFERRDVGHPIALQLLEIREQPGIRLAAVEERDGMPIGHEFLDDRRAEEVGATEHQDLLAVAPPVSARQGRRGENAGEASGSGGFQEGATIRGHSGAPWGRNRLGR
jgi:hypothetical protein